MRDEFALNNNWGDPAWTNVYDIRDGLDAEAQDRRQDVFGLNLIDIEQKPLSRILSDEVSSVLVVLYFSSTNAHHLLLGFPSLLHLSVGQSHPLGPG